VSLAENLLQSITDVFPECDETKHALELFGVMVKGDATREDSFVRLCVRLFKENSARLKNHDEEALFAVVDGIQILQGVEIRSKWSDPDFSTESKENMWSYLSALQTYGGLYVAVPAGVMDQIEKVAGSMNESLSNGSFDLANFDFAAFGDSLLSGLSKEEVVNFEGSLPDIYACVGNVAQLIAKQSGNDAFDAAALVERVVAMQNGAGGMEGLSELAGLSGLGGSGLNDLMQQLGGGQGLSGIIQQLGNNPDLSKLIDAPKQLALAAPAAPADKRRKKKK
jgi:hypothetical protein